MTRVSVLDLGAEWTQCERELAAKGSPLGFFHTSAWARYNTEEGVSALLFSVRDTAGVCTGAFAVESHPVRTLPGHRILLVRRLGVGAGGLEDDAGGLHSDQFRGGRGGAAGEDVGAGALGCADV